VAPPRTNNPHALPGRAAEGWQQGSKDAADTRRELTSLEDAETAYERSERQGNLVEHLALACSKYGFVSVQMPDAPPLISKLLHKQKTN